jgi:hypothetical protein
MVSYTKPGSTNAPKGANILESCRGLGILMLSRQGQFVYSLSTSLRLSRAAGPWQQKKTGALEPREGSMLWGSWEPKRKYRSRRRP